MARKKLKLTEKSSEENELNGWAEEISKGLDNICDTYDYRNYKISHFKSKYSFVFANNSTHIDIPDQNASNEYHTPCSLHSHIKETPPEIFNGVPSQSSQQSLPFIQASPDIWTLYPDHQNCNKNSITPYYDTLKFFDMPHSTHDSQKYSQEFDLIPPSSVKHNSVFFEDSNQYYASPQPNCNTKHNGSHHSNTFSPSPISNLYPPRRCF